MTEVTLPNGTIVPTGSMLQEFADSDGNVGHRLWQPGQRGPAAAITSGPAPDIDGFDLVIEASHTLTPAEQATVTSILAANAAKVRDKLDAKRRKLTPVPRPTAAPSQQTASSEVVFRKLPADQFMIDPQEVRDYVPTKINGVDAFKVFDMAREVGSSILLEGETGTGKTLMVRAYAAKRKIPCFKISGTPSASTDDIFGYERIEDGNTVAQLGIVPTAITVKTGSVLLIDEMGRFLPEILAPTFSLHDSSRDLTLTLAGGVVLKVEPGVLIVGTNNPGYEGVQREDDALRRRFEIPVQYETPRAVEKKLVKSSVLLDIADRLRASYRTRGIQQWTALPTLIAFERHANRLGLKFATQTFISTFKEPGDRKTVEDVMKSFRANLEVSFTKKDEDDDAVDPALEALRAKLSAGNEEEAFAL